MSHSISWMTVGWVMSIVLAIHGPAMSQELGRRYAVLAGVEDYDHAKLEKLEYADDDAQALAELLGKAGYQVTLLCDSAGKANSSQRPIKANLDVALAR